MIRNPQLHALIDIDQGKKILKSYCKRNASGLTRHASLKKDIPYNVNSFKAFHLDIGYNLHFFVFLILLLWFLLSVGDNGAISSSPQ